MRKDADVEKLAAAIWKEGFPGELGQEVDPNDPRLGHFQKIADAMRLEYFDAPEPLVQEAKALMPEREKRSLFAKLRGTTRILSGARASEANSFQNTFQAEDLSTRLMYVRTPKGWDVTGQAPEGYTVERLGRRIGTDKDGRFTFQAKSLADTGLILRDAATEVHVPSADEAQVDDAH